MLCYFADPKIYIFPRTRKKLCKENPNTKQLEFITMIDGFQDSEIECPIQKKKFKEIETRIYTDLAQKIDNNTVKVSRYFSVGYLKKLDDNYSYFLDIHKHNHALEIIAECSDSNIHCSLSWTNDRNNSVSNDDDNSLPIIILPTGYNGKNSLQDILLNIRFSKNIEINNQKIIVRVKKKDSEQWKEEFKFTLYKNQQNDIKAFNYENKKMDDFFVIPIATSPSISQKSIISELQKLNNQVLARNKKMGTDFSFLSESGELDEEQKLVSNIRKSLRAFKTSVDNSSEGCTSGTVILGTKTNGIVSNYPYNFNNFGQDEELIEYISNEYIVDKETLKGIIVDKNYLFGNYIRGNPQSEIEGIKNLYDYVVVPFIDGIIRHAESYLNFNIRWLSCPKYNNLYQRGVYTIPNGKKKILYKKDGTTETLTEGTKIYFESGADKYAFDKGYQKHRYKVVKINSQNVSGEVELTLDDKKSCDDSKFSQNYSNYVEIDKSVTNKNDKKALSIYNQTNGIPYYMNGMDSANNKNSEKLKTEEILNWSEQEKNWYSYKKKPNTGDFGIDCSGFVSNCLASFSYDNKTKHFLNLNNYFQKNVNSSVFLNKLCHKIPLIGDENKYIFQNTDCLISPSPHIVLIDTERNLVLRTDYDLRIVQTIHNYFGYNNTTKITLLTNDNTYKKGYFSRTLKGPYRHAGISVSSTTVGRICLWY